VILPGLKEPGDRTKVGLYKGDKIYKYVYRPQLIAAWASTWLVNYYWISAKSDFDDSHKEMELANKFVEIPLRSFGLVLRSKNKYYSPKI
jgi:hypothetical protein